MPGGRKPEGKVARTVTVSFKMTPAQKRILDSARGSTPVSAYLRNLIVADVRRTTKTGR
jgi:hypothetical protein